MGSSGVLWIWITLSAGIAAVSRRPPAAGAAATSKPNSDFTCWSAAPSDSPRSMRFITSVVSRLMLTTLWSECAGALSGVSSTPPVTLSLQRAKSGRIL